MPRRAKQPDPLPVMIASGHRDWWDGPDPTLLLRCEIEAGLQAIQAAILRERRLLAEERRRRAR
jgi:hypothetical protein